MVGVLVYREETGHRFNFEGCENRICPFEFVPTENFDPRMCVYFFAILDAIELF